MGRSFCKSSLAFVLKFLNYLQTFVGVFVVLYSLWMLSHWSRDGGAGSELGKHPAPWFVYTVMGVGVLLCLIALMGHIAAEAINGCCLCIYAVLTWVLILMEAALMAALAFDKHWEEDLPHDATGELKNLRAIIEANIDLFKWLALTVLIVQALSLLLAMVLRAMVPPRRMVYESDEDITDISKPLLNPIAGPASASSSIDGTGICSDTWRSRMRQKYGLVPSSTVDRNA